MLTWWQDLSSGKDKSKKLFISLVLVHCVWAYPFYASIGNLSSESSKSGELLPLWSLYVSLRQERGESFSENRSNSNRFCTSVSIYLFVAPKGRLFDESSQQTVEWIKYKMSVVGFTVVKVCTLWAGSSVVFLQLLKAGQSRVGKA